MSTNTLELKSQRKPIDLSGAHIRGTNLSKTDLARANFSNANLAEIDLSGSNLQGADLSSTNLRKANLVAANLSHADLTSSDLSGADLSNADLSYADFSAAKLNEAILSNAKLEETNIQFTNLSLTDFQGANLRLVKNLTWNQIFDSRFDEETMLPDYLDSVGLISHLEKIAPEEEWRKELPQDIKAILRQLKILSEKISKKNKDKSINELLFQMRLFRENPDAF